MKIIRWLSIFSFISLSIYVLYWGVFAILFSYGSGGSGKIKNYQFEMSSSTFKNEIISLSHKISDLSCKDSINDMGGGYKQKMLIIIIKKDIFIIKDAEGGDFYTSFNLISINGMTDKDFGWLSIEKHQKVKLFEKVIIEPISKKYKRVEVE